MGYGNQAEVRNVVFETLKVRKRLIKLNSALSRAESEQLFECEKYQVVLKDYLTLESEYSDVLQKVKIINHQFEMEKSVSLTPSINQIHNQSKVQLGCTDVSNVLESLDRIAGTLISSLDDETQQEIQKILYKRQ